MSSKIQVDLVLNSDRFSSAIRSDIYSVNLFTNAVVRAGNALKNLEKPLKIKLKDELLLLQKIMKEFMDDTKKDLEDTIKNLKEIDDRVKSVKISYEKMSQTAKPNMSYSKTNTTINNSQKKDDLSLGDIAEKILNADEAFRNIKEDIEKAKEKKQKSKDNNKNTNTKKKEKSKSNSNNKNQKGKSKGSNGTFTKINGKLKEFLNKASSGIKSLIDKLKSNNQKGNKNKSLNNGKSPNKNKSANKSATGNRNKGVQSNGKKKGGFLQGMKDRVMGGSTKSKPGGKGKAAGKGGLNLVSIIKDSTKAGGALNKLGSIGSKVFGVLGKAVKLFGVVFKAVPIVGWILTIIDIVITLKNAWDDNFMGIQDIVSSVWNFIKDAFSSIKKYIGDLGDSLRNSAFGKFAGKVINFVTGGEESGNSRAFGQRVIPYDNFPILAHQGESLLTANETRRLGEGSAIISKLADTIVVREDADIDKIANALISRLDKARFNMA